MTPIRFGAPVAALLILSGPVWAQAPANTANPPAQPPAAAAPLPPVPATPAPAAAAPANPAPAAAAPATPAPTAAAPMTPAPTAAAPMTPAKSAPVAQAAPTKPLPKKRIVRRRLYREHYLDTDRAADALNGRELRESPVVASRPRPVAAPAPAYPAAAYYPPPPAYYPPPPPPYYPPPWYYRPYRPFWPFWP